MSATAVWEAIGGIVGILGIIAVLARISYQIGALVTEFRAYVKLNDLVVSEVKTRLDRLESRRR